EISAVTNQHVNSYKRLWTRHEAPSYISWGHRNRSALVRVPQYNSGKSSSARVEYRALDSSANPYLSYALMLAAGRKGIEEGYELPDEAEDNVWLLSDTERRAMGIEALPGSLSHALEIMESSDLVAETLGEEVFDFFLRNKRQECNDYRAQVTPYERAKHFPAMYSSWQQAPPAPRAFRHRPPASSTSSMRSWASRWPRTPDSSICSWPPPIRTVPPSVSSESSKPPDPSPSGCCTRSGPVRPMNWPRTSSTGRCWLVCSPSWAPRRRWSTTSCGIRTPCRSCSCPIPTC